MTGKRFERQKPPADSGSSVAVETASEERRPRIPYRRRPRPVDPELGPWRWRWLFLFAAVIWSATVLVVIALGVLLLFGVDDVFGVRLGPLATAGAILTGLGLVTLAILARTDP